MAQSILTNATVASTGHASNIVIGVTVTALITRALGPDRYGVYATLLTVGIIAQLIADSGLYLVLTKSIARNPQQQNDIISSIMSLRILLLVMAFTTSAVAISYIPSLAGQVGSFMVLALGLGLQSLSQLCMGVFQNAQVVWRATVGDISGRVIHLAIVIIVVVVGATLARFISALAISLAAAFAIHNYLLPNTPWRLVFRKEEWKKTLKQSWPLGLMLVLNAIFFRLDLVIISLFHSAQEVGYYGVAFRILESALFLPAVLGGLLLPRLTKAITNHQAHYVRKIIAEAVQVTIAVAILVVIVLVSKRVEVVNLIAGPAYAGAASLVGLLAIAMAIIFIGNIFGFTLVAMEKQLALVKLYATLAAANIVGNLLVVPTYGAPGAAAVTIITEFFSMFVAFWMVVRQYSFHIPVVFILKALVVGCITTLVALTIPTTMHVIVQCTLLSVVYVALGNIFRLVTKKNVALLSESPQ